MKQSGEKSFGNRLLEAFQGASQTDIAQQLGLSNAAITNYVEGRIPPAETLIKISSLTGCSIHWLITGAGFKKASERNRVGESNAQTIMLVNEKGGSAKSTSTVFLSIEFAKRGYRTLVVDSSLGHCTFGLFAPLLSKLFWQYTPVASKTSRRPPRKRTFFKTEIPGLHLCTTYDRTLSILTDQGFKSFNTEPEAIRRDYDFVVMDTESGISPFETLNPFTAALAISAKVLMPVHAHPFSLRPVERTLINMRNALQSTGDLNFLGAFLTTFFFDRETSLMMVDKLSELLPGKVLKTIIYESEEIAGLGSYSPLQLTHPESRGAAEYSPLAEEVLTLLGMELRNTKSHD